MGYRSDVRISTSREGFNKLNKYVEEYLKNNTRSFSNDNLLTQCDILVKNDKMVYFGWDNIKWYDDIFEDIKAICYGLKKMDVDNYSYNFARLGEEIDDYEESYNSSDKEDYIQFPFINRSFDDEYYIEKMNINENKNEYEV